ncbi:AraC family transcriptional regulator [Bosea caraganae]|uniref:AraC family transcriptional regulator n=1 Tax=Bosea caraganae TaxID=2763117 RepID=A0A370L652_9HYPH|nr:AraC family transcriptional regulator [Bosea caraganae]RDJ23125.1 AraC family transcriptional regulator [Bosea caraganae]RDJ24762.1 AraC family transcriptional regulator [Bosea caraganae]
MRRTVSDDSTIERLSTRPDGWRRTAWTGGSFETAQRPLTTLVEGCIRSDRHLIMVTLRGGAERHEIWADDGHRYDGPDRPGSVSFLPAGCERRLRLRNVAWRWAAIGLQPCETSVLGKVGPFSGAVDDVLSGLLAELERLDAIDGGLDAAYCETMSLAMTQYIAQRYGREGMQAGAPITLPAWRLRRVTDYIDGALGGEIRIAELAGRAGLSEGHFHRAFRTTTGQTPLAYIQRRRVDAAMQMLAREKASIVDVALRVGFVSPTHFARVFRSVTGKNPSDYRRDFGLG